MVTKIFCNKCGIQLHAGPEGSLIAVNVDGMAYYEGHLCKEHWKELMKVLDSYFQGSGDKL